MPRVGNGTGMGKMPPQDDGLTMEDETPETPGAPYRSTPKGQGAVLEGDSSNRMAPLSGK